MVIFWIFLGFFWRNLFGRIFLEDFFGRIFWEEFFGRNYLVEVNKELMFLSRLWGNFVSMEKEEGRNFRSLEVRRKLIALKKYFLWGNLVKSLKDRTQKRALAPLCSAE